ncbi:CARDB domain-containing protein [Candidatus Chloroploca asiatica]|uniref:CARDB domain-containing protein n=1 Tax=Candidatus Chloroploca asiatica TaxID=1506545 RepID=A0A2H3KYF9_9CHLR|nr:FG-GAP-like repeat-containing protein [Candidatus Chloroploca asiatica]PDV99024.1 hypothetical protein A9Q02_13770 [Candidatus Chloroploca asiatica]
MRWNLLLVFSFVSLLLLAPYAQPNLVAPPRVGAQEPVIPQHAPGRPSKITDLEQVLAENPDLDPLAGTTTLLDAADLVLFWNGPTPTDSSGGDQVVYHRFYDASGPLLPVTSPLTATVSAGWAITPTADLSGTANPAFVQGSPMDVVTLNLNGDLRSDLVGAGIDKERRVLLFAPQLEGGEQVFTWAQAYTATSRMPLDFQSNYTRQIRLAAGDVDGDRYDEVVLAYQGVDGQLHLEVFDGDGGHQIRRVSTTSLVAPTLDRWGIRNFDVAVGDFNGNGKSEVAVIAADENVEASGYWGIYLQIFELVDGLLQPRLKTYLVGPEEVATLVSNASPGDLSVAAANFDDDVALELVFGYGIRQPSRSKYESFAGLMDVRADLLAVTELDRQQIDQSSADFRTIAVGDMNLDGKDELVFATESLMVYHVDDQGKLAPRGNLGDLETRGSSQRPVVMADLNRDLRAEIIFVNYLYNGDRRQQQTQMRVYGADLDEGGNIRRLVQRTEVTHDLIESPCCTTNYALAAGDFDGDSVRLGPPVYRRESNVGQVLAIINAPPSHFDILPDGTEISVNVCENPNIPAECTTSVYYETSTTTSEIAVDIQRSWTLGKNSSEDVQGPSVIDEVINEIKRINAALVPPSDPSIEDLINYIEQNVINLNGPEIVTRLIDLLNSGNNVLGSHVATSIERSYGTNFEKATTSIESVRLQQSILAGRDDVIIRTESDYDTWEYPIYTDESGTVAGHLLVVWPVCDNNRCSVSAETIVPGKQLASGYIPSHEPLNLLSYPREAPPTFRLYNQIAQFRRVNVGEQVTEFELTLSKIREDRGSNSRSQSIVNGREVQTGGAEGSIEINAGLDFEVFQIGAATSSDYKRPYFVERYSDEYGSERISNHEFRLQQDTVVRIRIGALTGAARQFPYRVEPFVYWSPGFNAFVIDYAAEPIIEPGNGWDVYYNRPDLAFNLPWRYGEQGQSLRQRTRQIRLNPPLPEPGDPVELVATIHNYGLQHQAEPFHVAFYLAPPGTTIPQLIPDPDRLIGRDRIDRLDARSSTTATVNWTTPPGEGEYTVYALIETGAASLAEVHTANNAAYAPLLLGNQSNALRALLYVPIVFR